MQQRLHMRLGSWVSVYCPPITRDSVGWMANDKAHLKAQISSEAASKFELRNRALAAATGSTMLMYAGCTLIEHISLSLRISYGACFVDYSH